jgi:hypothetical protein
MEEQSRLQSGLARRLEGATDCRPALPVASLSVLSPEPSMVADKITD